ncbi:MAG: hypothetical protein JOZ43_06945 [Acidobacteriales bacterium]|nr:hypothetical protein [Terriglobales bacterium]
MMRGKEEPDPPATGRPEVPVEEPPDAPMPTDPSGPVREPGPEEPTRY